MEEKLEQLKKLIEDTPIGEVLSIAKASNILPALSEYFYIEVLKMLRRAIEKDVEGAMELATLLIGIRVDGYEFLITEEQSSVQHNQQDLSKEKIADLTLEVVRLKTGLKLLKDTVDKILEENN